MIKVFHHNYLTVINFYVFIHSKHCLLTGILETGKDSEWMNDSYYFPVDVLQFSSTNRKYLAISAPSLGKANVIFKFLHLQGGLNPCLAREPLQTVKMHFFFCGAQVLL